MSDWSQGEESESVGEWVSEPGRSRLARFKVTSAHCRAPRPPRLRVQTNEPFERGKDRMNKMTDDVFYQTKPCAWRQFKVLRMAPVQSSTFKGSKL